MPGTGEYEGQLICPVHGRPCEQLQEENWFFQLSAFTERLIERRVHPCDQILAHRPDYRPRRLLGVFKTKFFVGRGKWRDFIQLSGSTRAALGIAQAQMRHQGEVSGLVRMVLGLNTAPAAGALTSGAKGDK